MAEKIKIGVCVMEKKVFSAPMGQIFDRLQAFGEFEVIHFGDKVILEEPVESWPICDCLIAFYSSGYPLEKAEAYAALRKPFLVNELEPQHLLHDRRKVYERLEMFGIPVPRYALVIREVPDQELDYFIEEEDFVEVHGMRFWKPFVEKPVDADNHSIMIYYPSSAGGGMKELFRKVGNRSSDFHPDVRRVRREGSYIYEEFMPTGGTDVKVYTVGPEYAHAEARKSPVVDGVVMRNTDGKEVRYPVLLTPAEKEMAREVCIAFKQAVCGFDLLRSEGRSYVCDVNGWSFVKNSYKYYDDAACVLRKMLLDAKAPHLSSAIPPILPWKVNEPVQPTEGLTRQGSGINGTFGQSEELRCVIAVIRHGDRTPKQKVKLMVTEEKLLNLMLKYNGGRPRSETKLKSAVQLQDLLDATRMLVPCTRPDRESDSEAEDIEHAEKLRQVKAVLEEGGHFSGIYRKVQLKPLKWVKVAKNNGEIEERPVEALMVLKYGGVLTHAGRKQAEELGRYFRNKIYPGVTLDIVYNAMIATNTVTLQSSSPPFFPSPASPLQAVSTPLVLPLPSMKLTEKNYLVWRLFMLATLTSKRANQFVLRTEIPHRFMSEDDGLKNRVNPAYLRWEELDQTVFSWILNSLSEGLQPCAVGCVHSWQLWEELDSFYNSQTKARSRQLRSQLRSISQGSSSISDFFTKIKGLVDALISIGTPISTSEHIDYILDGLNEEYQPVITSIESQINLPSIHKLESFLLNFESRLEEKKNKVLSNALSTNVAIGSASPPPSKPIHSYSQQNPLTSQVVLSLYSSCPKSQVQGYYGGYGGSGGYRVNRGGRRGGHNRSGRGSGRSSPVFCVYCNRHGHEVNSCYYAPQNFGVSLPPFSYNMPRQEQNYFRSFNGPQLRYPVHFFPEFTDDFYLGYSPPSHHCGPSYYPSQHFNEDSLHRPDPSYPSRQPFQPYAMTNCILNKAIPSTKNFRNVTWYPNSGATNHLTMDPALLHEPVESFGYDQIFMGNGIGISIQSISNSHFTSSLNSNISFHLNNLLLVPSITKNLIRVTVCQR